MEFYLFASTDGTTDDSSATVFYVVEREALAKSLCKLFTREYADSDGRPAFHYKSAAEMSIEGQVLLDESLAWLAIYDDPDPGIYDPPPPNDMLLLAQYGVRARGWEELLRERAETTMKKTVVELDLVGYSTICDNFEQGLGVNSAAQLNEQIQTFVDAGLKAVNASRNQHVMQTTGDGAIVVFDTAGDAHRFAQAVHDATREHNRLRKQPLAKRVFRIGAASGDVVMQPKPNGGFDIAGMTIARAVRLEASAQPGGLLVDEATFEALAPEQSRHYGLKQLVAGKRDEQFEAYLSQLNTDGPEDATFFTKKPKKDTRSETGTRKLGRDKRRQILALFKGLMSHQYADLIFLLEVPIGQRPTEALNLDQQKAQVLKWAEENAELDSLLEELTELSEIESRDRPK